MMPQCVTVQIEPPDDWSTGIVAEGYYEVLGDKLIMTFADGKPVEIAGARVERTLSPGEDARKIAGRLTREIRRSISGKSPAQEAFSRSINYRPAGFA